MFQVHGSQWWKWGGAASAGVLQQYMIISLLLWSGFCLMQLSGLWPLTSSLTQTTIPLCWRPNRPSVRVSLMRQRSPPWRSAADEWVKKHRAGETGGRGGGGRGGGGERAVGGRNKWWLGWLTGKDSEGRVEIKLCFLDLTHASICCLHQTLVFT